MQYPYPLHSATLIKRYKRFLADVYTSDQKQLTLHCANTGAMTGCAEPGDTVWYGLSDSKTRKYPGSWELTQTSAGHWICINTLRANSLVKEAIEQKKIPQLAQYNQIRSEVKYGSENSRIDLLLSADHLADCYIEIKSVTLFEAKTKIGYFPDAVTTRGQKHIRELQMMVAEGKRAILFFLVQHSGISQFRPADHIDPRYSQLLRGAVKQGVEVLCYKTHIDPLSIFVTEAVQFEI